MNQTNFCFIHYKILPNSDVIYEKMTVTSHLIHYDIPGIFNTKYQ